MLFLVTWDFTDTSEEGMERSLAVFQNWRPPEGVEFKGFYGFADQGGGCAIVEAQDAGAISRTTAPFIPWMAFTVRPIVPVEESAQIAVEALNFLKSVQ
jgi:hypothetical protein